VRSPRRGAQPHDGWTSPVSSALALAGFLGVVFVGFTLLALEPLMAIDAYFNLDPPSPTWLPILHVLDRVGQRAICLPVLGLVVFLCWRRSGSWRPPIIAAVSVFCLNLLVLILKVSLGRGQPALADPSFFIGGMAYPSGHTANIVLVYGLAAYLLGRYYRVSTRVYGVMWTGVALLSMMMVVVSMSLNWHWFADLVAGLIIGGLVLEVTVAADIWTATKRNPVRG
jgi:membrane-associated phospholipid phosphatase